MSVPNGSALWDLCSGTAHNGIFWRKSTHGHCDHELTNIALLLGGIQDEALDASLNHVDDHFACKAVVVEPYLPELRMTPPHREHMTTEIPVVLLVSKAFVKLRATLMKAVENQEIVCVIAARTQQVDQTIQVTLADQNSGVAVWPNDFDRGAVRCAELFCGGYAGWDFAIKYLASLGVPVKTVVAIDASLQAVQMYAMNHAGLIMGILEDPRAMEYVISEHEVLVLPFPVQLPKWYHLLSDHMIQLWCISPPCPAFSRASDMMGFLRNDGKITLETICTIRLCQPFVICLENVPGMAEPENLRIMVGMFRWAGYKLIHHECNDLGDVCPTNRKRWLSIWVRQDLAPETVKVSTSWFQARDFTINDFGAMHMHFEDDILGEFTLDEHLMKQYGDVTLFPYNMKKNRKITDVNSGCQARCVVGSGKYGTFVASYGFQHDLPRDKLESRGMFAQLIACDETTFRFITPFEQAIAFASRVPFMVPLDHQDAFRAMGNAIAPPQALYCLAKALQGVSIADMPSMDAMLFVIQFVSQRPKTHDIHVIKLDNWYMMMNGDYMPEGMVERDLSLKPRQVSNGAEPTPVQATLVDHEGATEMSHEPVDKDEPEPKRHCHVDNHPTVSPTEHFEADSNCGGLDVFDDQIPEATYANVTIVFPHGSLVGRFAVPTTAREILKNHGYDPDRMMLRTLHGRGDVMDFPILQDTIMVTMTDCIDQIEDAARNFRGSSKLHFGNQGPQPKVNVVIRYRHVTFWEGVLGYETDLRDIDKVVTAELRRVGIKADLRWSHRFTALNHHWGWRLKDITGAGTIKLFFNLPVSGGGPKDTKVDENLKSRLAAELVGAGVGFSHLVPYVTMISSSCSVIQIQQAIQTNGVEARQRAIMDLATKAGCSTDAKYHAGKRAQAATKIQKAVRTKKAQGQLDLDITNLVVDENDFENEDMTAATITTGPFQPNGSGVYLTTLDCAMPWLQSTSTISADELCILLVGHVKVDTQLKYKHVQFRAKQNHGGILLLRGTIFQLGAKEVKHVEGKVTKISCPSTSVVTFTVHADEYSAAMWSNLTSSPGRCMLDLFDHDVRKQAVLGIWGHSYQLKGKPSKADNCDSVQIHARVLTSFMQALLKESGWNGVYMVPKGDDQNKSAMPDSQYSVVWTGLPKQETMVAAKEIQATLGLVRNRNSVGIRVSSAAFESAWKKLHPNKDVPCTVKVQSLFKAQNIPCNFTVVELRQWIDSVGWKAKPLKKLSHTAWLLGADGDPPQNSFVINDNVILLTGMNRKAEPETPVLAGKPVAVTKNHDRETKDVDLVTDPWQQWRENHPGKSAFATPAPSSKPSRNVEGPVNAKLTEQDAKIEQLHRSFEELQHKMQEDSSQLKQSMQHQTEQFSRFTTAVEQRIVSQEQETNSKFGSIQRAIDQGRRAQDEQFKILREMLMQANVNGSRKASKTDGNTTPGGKDDSS
eukprot:Skav204982  [mRNA]  locus=scaffold1180:361350:365699:- [translate_table: standard]